MPSVTWAIAGCARMLFCTGLGAVVAPGALTPLSTLNQASNGCP
jgi:hypothetical protein